MCRISLLAHFTSEPATADDMIPLMRYVPGEQRYIKSQNLGSAECGIPTLKDTVSLLRRSRQESKCLPAE